MLRRSLAAWVVIAALAGTPALAQKPPAAKPAAATKSPAAKPAPPRPAATAGQLAPVQQFTLANGLRVVFHVDRSDPVTAVVLAPHVGSSRETPGRTGFAHLFEHLFFLESENLGKGGLDKLSARVGGSGADGSTDRDITDYLQTVPNDALEKMIWAEADKLGFFINTVTDPVLAKEKQVVKNEKRELYDNQPYGHASFVVAGQLYPRDHPYSWPLIGSMADLDAATLSDVKAFYRRWSTPGNVTLVIAGDFDPGQARRWVEKYCAESPMGAAAPKPQPRRAALSANRNVYYPDAFAELPQLTLAWPTVPRHHKDAWALTVLFDLLTAGKDAPLSKVLVDEQRLTAEVTTQTSDGVLAGEHDLTIQAFKDVDLDRVRAGITQGFARFEKEGIAPDDLARVKIWREAEFYRNFESVLGKARNLARYDVYAGTPDFADRDLAMLRAVTAADVQRVYRAYIKGRPHVAASFVPKDQPQLAMQGAALARVVEEKIVQGAEKPVDPDAGQASYKRTASSFNRTVEPPYGPAPQVTTPAIWEARLPNGLRLMGIQDRELPLATFELSIDGGRLFDDPRKPGAANLLAQMLTKGTVRRTRAQFEEALQALGAEVTVTAADERFLVSGRTLARNFPATLDLLEEMILEPRWDEGELRLAKAAVVASIQSRRVEAPALAERVMAHVTYGPNHPLGVNSLGAESSVQAFTMAELKALHAKAIAPNLARFRVVGAVDRNATVLALRDLGRRWKAGAAKAPAPPAPDPPAASRVVFYDLPDAKQSMLQFGYPALRRNDPDYYPAWVTNYVLGGGGFASRLIQQVREEKGYTYGVRSAFRGGAYDGAFQVTSPVRANVTLEASTLIRDIVRDYGKTFTAQDLEVTRSFISKSNARAFETPAAKLKILANIGDYGLARDYQKAEARVVSGMTVEKVQAIAAKHLHADAMTYVIVGDAKTQAGRVAGLGYGAPVMIADEFDR